MDGDGKCTHAGQLGPYAPSLNGLLGPATTPAARGRIVVCSLDGSDGDDVTKVNDLTSRPHSLKRLFKVLRSSVVLHVDKDNVRQVGRRPGGTMFVHPPLHVDDLPNGSVGNAAPVQTLLLTNTRASTARNRWGCKHPNRSAGAVSQPRTL